MLCGSGLEFNKIINILLDILSIDIDHVYIAKCIVIELFPNLMINMYQMTENLY